MLLTPQRLPPSMQVLKSQTISRDDIATLSQKYGRPIVAATKQTLDVNRSRVVVTAIKCGSRSDRDGVYSRLLKTSGRLNPILPGEGATVFEIRTLDPVARLAVAELLPIAEAQIRKLQPGEYPGEWSLVSDSSLDERGLAGINDKLQVQATGVVNQIFQTGATGRIQVNTMTAATQAAAIDMHQKLSKLVGHVNTVLIHDLTVYELISSDAQAKQLITAALKRAPIAVFRVTFRVGPLATGDDMLCTPIFNAFLRYQGGKPEERSAAADELARYRKRLTFADTLRLQASTRARYRLSHDFQPEPAGRSGDGSDQIVVTFADLPKVLDYPVITVTASYRIQDRFLRSEFPAEAITAADRTRLTGPTKYWPTEDPRIQQMLAQSVDDDQGELEKVEAIRRAVHSQIRFAGKSKGSRYGVPRVLQQQFGHCWDKSDVYVTLARAAGIPTRQIGGWVAGRSGHAWSESHVSGVGWIPVDATADQLGVSRNYLPLFSTDDGSMKILHTALPQIERME